MPDLKFKIKIDIEDLKKQIKQAVNSTISLDGGGGSGGKGGGAKVGKGGGKVAGLLGGILKGLGPLSVLLSLKPIADLLKILTNFIMLGFLKMIKFIQNLPETIKKLRTTIVEWLKSLPGKIWGFMKSLPGKIWSFLSPILTSIWEWIKSLPGKLWEFLKTLPGLIWGYIVQGFNWLVEKLGVVKNFLLEKLESLKEILKSKFDEWKETLKIKFDEWKEKLATKFDEWKETLKIKFDEWKTKVGEWFKELPQKIWDKMKALGDIIKGAISAAVAAANPFGGRGDSKKKSRGPQSGDNVFMGSMTSPGTLNDFISRPGQPAQPFSNQDTIIGTKNPGGLGGTTMNFYGVTPQRMINIINAQQGKGVNTGGRY